MASAFTPSQIDAYLDHIGLPPQYRLTTGTPPPQTLSFLTQLGVHHLCAVPYENLLLHYSKSHSISLDMETLYTKIVTNKRGRGGYCMENCLLYLNILRGLGFDAYPTGVRIRNGIVGTPEGEYIGLRHILNIVTLPDGSRYAVDVSFGGDGPTKPLPLIGGVVTQNIGTQEIRLAYDHIPDQTARKAPNSKFWIYQYRNSTTLPWNSFYCFTEQEFLWRDFEIMNWYTSTHPESFQTFIPLVIKFLRRAVDGNGHAADGEDQGGQEQVVYGKVMLVKEQVKRNTGGRTEVVKTCETEAERVESLKEYFQIHLTEEEKDGIVGRVTEIKSHLTANA